MIIQGWRYGIGRWGWSTCMKVPVDYYPYLPLDRKRALTSLTSRGLGPLMANSPTLSGTYTMQF